MPGYYVLTSLLCSPLLFLLFLSSFLAHSIIAPSLPLYFCWLSSSVCCFHQYSSSTTSTSSFPPFSHRNPLLIPLLISILFPPASHPLLLFLPPLAPFSFHLLFFFSHSYFLSFFLSFFHPTPPLLLLFFFSSSPFFLSILILYFYSSPSPLLPLFLFIFSPLSLPLHLTSPSPLSKCVSFLSPFLSLQFIHLSSSPTLTALTCLRLSFPRPHSHDDHLGYGPRRDRRGGGRDRLHPPLPAHRPGQIPHQTQRSAAPPRRQPDAGMLRSCMHAWIPAGIHAHKYGCAGSETSKARQHQSCVHADARARRRPHTCILLCGGLGKKRAGRASHSVQNNKWYFSYSLLPDKFWWSLVPLRWVFFLEMRFHQRAFHFNLPRY